MSITLSRAEVETLLPYMRDVTRCEMSLRELNLMWSLIEASAKMNCPQDARTILPTMAATRTQFGQMERNLVSSLVLEKLRNALGQVQTRAQYVIDIVVRNLYERTADVGFLATDPELCNFVADPVEEDGRIDRRLQEYRHKYTVYDEILLLDTAGQVLAQTDRAAPVECTRDPLLSASLASDTYLETFRATDLRPHTPQALLYSRRMHRPGSAQPVGVLCLSFNFQQEMQGIFASHGDPSGRSVMLLLDDQHRIIASSNEGWMPLGTSVPVNRDQHPGAFVHQGRLYLIATQASPGYQGYPGPTGWLGQVMMPLDVAFDQADTSATDALPPHLRQGLLSHAGTFCPPLHDIMVAAQHIQRIVWNGQVMTAGNGRDMTQLKTVLEQISETGHRSSKLFRESIDALYQTVLGTGLTQAGYTARLLVDLLDRNLYERADDCRWWALNPQLREGMAAPDATARAAMTEVLGYINSLYTVYTRLYLYDARGAILVSTGTPLPDGARVEPDTLARVLALSDTQHYHVEGFGPHPLYADAATYVYHAAIRHPQDPKRVIGGIGLVFDSAPELRAMLDGAVAQKADTHALFVSPQGQVLASTHPDHPVGSAWQHPVAAPAPARGQFDAQIGVHAGQYAVVATSTSAGYREFKTSDGHRDDVQAIVIRHFGAVQSHDSAERADDVLLETTLAEHGKTQEYATFWLDGQLMALHARHVLEAVSAGDMRRMALGRGAACIGMVSRQAAGESGYVWVHDLAQLLGRAPARGDGQVLVLRVGTHTCGLLVDELHAVAEVEDRTVVPNPLGGAHWVSHIIRANQGRVAIQLLDGERLVAFVRRQGAAAA